MKTSDKISRTIGYSCFLKRRIRRRSRQLLLGRGRRKHHIARHTKVVPSCDSTSTTKPKDFKNLLFFSQNISGLSDQTREEALHMMEKHNVCLMLLQETWTGTSPRESEFEDKPNGYLFLLKGNKKPIGKKGRNQCGIGFILSPFARKAWIASGQEAIKLHHCNDSMARIASIKLLFKRGNSNH